MIEFVEIKKEAKRLHGENHQCNEWGSFESCACKTKGDCMACLEQYYKQAEENLEVIKC